MIKCQKGCQSEWLLDPQDMGIEWGRETAVGVLLHPWGQEWGLDLERRIEWSSFSLPASLFCLPGVSPVNACWLWRRENVIN